MAKIPSEFGVTPDERFLELRGRERLTSRLDEFRLHSAALGRETRVRVLHPSPAVAPAGAELPVLFLLHGGGADSDHTNWTEHGGAEALTDGLPLLVVMPDGGKGGWYCDWLRPESTEGRQRWERYHMGELLPFVQTHFGTRADRAGTAIAGLSMGGFGAVHYAARHPDLFAFAAAFSGAVDIRHPGVGRVVRVSPQIMGGRRGDILGDHVDDEARWRAVNPVDLAANLATVEVELRTGNGDPGGPFGDGPAGDNQEIGVNQATANLHGRLVELGIPHVYDDYGAGAHTWPYWTDALRRSLPRIVASAAEARPDPERITHLAWEPSFSAWGYDVEFAGDEWLPTVLEARPEGVALRGGRSELGRVTTPAGDELEVPVTPEPA